MQVPFGSWFSTRSATLGGQTPADWVAADGPEAELADAYAEATGLRRAALQRTFPAAKNISLDQHLVEFMGLDSLAQVVKSMESARSVLYSPSMRAMLSAAEDMRRVYSPLLVSVLQEATASKAAFEAALTLSPVALDAIAAIQSSALPYAEIAALQANFKTAALAGVDWNLIRAPALEGLMAVRPLVANLDLQTLGLLSSSLWVEAKLAPAIAASFDTWRGLADVVQAESTAFARWLPQVDLTLAQATLATPAALGITTHVYSRGTIATIAPDWRRGDDASSVQAVVEISAHFRLPLDLEVPGASNTLRHVMERRLPRTLEALQGLAAVLNAPEMPNRAKLAAFAFRDALRSFYEEVTGEQANEKTERLRTLLAPQIQEANSGPYLLSSIQLLDDLYKPVAAAVYGRGGDNASFTLWTHSAIGAMATIVTYWLEANPTIGNEA